MKVIFSLALLALAVTIVTAKPSSSHEPFELQQDRILIKAICDKNDDPSVREWYMKRNQLADGDLQKCKSCMNECRVENQCMADCARDSKIQPTDEAATNTKVEKSDSDKMNVTMIRGEQNWTQTAIAALHTSSLCMPLLDCEEKNNCKMVRMSDGGFSHASMHTSRGNWRKTMDCLRNSCVLELAKCRECKIAQNVCKTQKCMAPCKMKCREKCNQQCGN